MTERFRHDYSPHIEEVSLAFVRPLPPRVTLAKSEETLEAAVASEYFEHTRLKLLHYRGFCPLEETLYGGLPFRDHI